jgi:RIO kinase 1
MLKRDALNFRSYFGRYAPELLITEYGKEIWSLYEHDALRRKSSLPVVSSKR